MLGVKLETLRGVIKLKREIKEINKVIGTNVRKHRKSNGLTQEQLSERLGLTTKFLGLVENGQAGVSNETLKSLCLELKVTSDELLFENIKNTDFTHINTLLERIVSVDRKHLKHVEKIIEEYYDGIRN